MAKRCIGIELGSTYLRAVQVSQAQEHFCIEKIFCTPMRRSTDSPVRILKSLPGKYGFDRRARLAVSLPQGAVLFRNIETNTTGLERIQRQDLSGLQDELPYPAGEVCLQVVSRRPLPEDRFAVLVAVARKKWLDEVLEVLSEAKMEPALVDARIFAVYNCCALNHSEIAVGRALLACINDGAVVLAAVEDNRIILVRNIPLVPAGGETESLLEQAGQIISREGRVSWQKAFGGDINQQSRLYLAIDAARGLELKRMLDEKLPCRTSCIDGRAGMEVLAEAGRDGPAGAAEGLALRLLAPEKTTGVNFLEAARRPSDTPANLKKDLITCLILFAAVVGLWLFGLFVRLGRLEGKYAQLKRQTEQLFHAALPEEKNIVNPLAQIEQKLQALQADYKLLAGSFPGTPDALEVLAAISASKPEGEDIRVDDLLISGESVRLRGTCDSFETVYRWQRLLQKVPTFESVELLNDLQKDQNTSRIFYTILISSTSGR